MTRTINIPYGLSEDEFAEFIREEVRKVGGDPDTLYLMDDMGEKHNGPITLTVKYEFDIPKKPVTMAYQQGFSAFGG